MSDLVGHGCHGSGDGGRGSHRGGLGERTCWLQDGRRHWHRSEALGGAVVGVECHG